MTSAMTAPKKVAHQLTENVKLLQKAVLLKAGKALIVRRSKDAASRPGFWDLPGGNSEWPDTEGSGSGSHRRDIAREIEEETGVWVDPEAFATSSLIYFDTYFDSTKQVFTVINGWYLELLENFDDDKISLSDEHTEFAWISPEELEEYDFGGEAGLFVVNMIENAFAIVDESDHGHVHGHEGGCCGGGGCSGGC